MSPVVVFDIGKTAYRRRKNSSRRDHLTVFERAMNSDVVKKVSNSLKVAIGRANEEITKPRLFLASVSFAQGIPYRTDSESVSLPEYPRYPVETLVEGVGDCEDTSYLLASLLSEPPLKADPVLVYFARHAGVAVPANQCPLGVDTDKNGVFEYDGEEFIYIETVSPTEIGVNDITDEPVRVENVAAIHDSGSLRHIKPLEMLDKEGGLRLRPAEI
jgi:hypothetical protein